MNEIKTSKAFKCKKCQGKLHESPEPHNIVSVIPVTSTNRTDRQTISTMTHTCVKCKTDYFRNFHGKLIEVKK